VTNGDNQDDFPKSMIRRRFEVIKLWRLAMKVLLAVDSSKFSERAVETVTKQIWPPGSEVRIISVVDLSYFPIPETSDFDQ